MSATPARASKQQAKRARRKAARLLLLERGPPSVAAVSRPGAPRHVKAVMDSGAEATVAPPKIFGTKVLPSRMSENGEHWTAANGSEIKAFGQTEVPFEDVEGNDRTLRFEVADVSTPLVSVAGVCDADNLVVFAKTGGFILSLKPKTRGNRMPFARRGNTYELDMLLKGPPAEEEEGDSDEGARASFHRQET